jgi:hypothetical protein
MPLTVSRLVAIALMAATSSAYAVPVSTTVNDTRLTVLGLVGVGRLPANLRDEHGETFGSVSGLYADVASWTRDGASYNGVFHSTPDRGYNVVGTIDYTARINRLEMVFTPVDTSATGLAQDQIVLSLAQATKLFERLPGGGTQAISSLDPKPGGVATGGARPASGSQPELPQAFNGKLSLDAEGIVKLADNSWLVSDEYGPSIYRFSSEGELLGALPVAESVRPMRGGVFDYSSNNPADGQPAPSPANPTAGRQNNQGFEGLSISPDGTTLFVALQSATRQDGGTGGASATRDHTRIFTYDISSPDEIELTGEYVVRLPSFMQGGLPRVAAQSEILAISGTQLLILPRDSNGLGLENPTSLYRHVDVVDLRNATNILGQPYESQVAPGGVLNPAITPAALASWLDINDNSELNRFGLTNGLLAGFDNLSEKWEGLVLLPALDPLAPRDWFLFVANDNDFLTTDGFHAGQAYAADFDNDTMLLAYRVRIAEVPEPATPVGLLLGLGLLAVFRRRNGPRPSNAP